MRILLTGGTGFIGRHLVERLAPEHELTCLVRESSKREAVDFLRGLRASLVCGDITDKSSLPRMDFDAVCHLAGILGSSLTPEKEYFRVHVDGTRNLLGLCSGRFIYCSSAGVLGPVLDGDETSPLNPTNPYEKSKAEAESLVRDYPNHVIIRPEFVYGPHDMHVLQLFRAIKDRRFFLIGRGESLLHPTYVDDVVHCLAAALSAGNGTYMVAGERAVPVKKLALMAAEMLESRAPGLSVPMVAARAYTALEPMFRKAGVEPVLTRSRLDFFTKSRSFKNAKARQAFGLEPKTLKEGLLQTLTWYRKNGQL